MIECSVIQPLYAMAAPPDAAIARFLLDEVQKAPDHSLIVLPEYSNAGGLSDKEQELAALGRAEEMKQAISCMAKEKSCYIVINVLERREGNLRNSSYLYGKDGKVAFVYDKIHLPPSETELGVTRGDGQCVCCADGIRFAFLTCYDVYFNEQIEYIAKQKPDVLVIPGYQRGERTDIICAQAKLAAFRCNAYVARASYSMGDELHGGCSMIVAPNGEILGNLGKEVGTLTVKITPEQKYMRAAGFGGTLVRNDDFISDGLCPQVFENLR